jgi:hypothetical protein
LSSGSRPPDFSHVVVLVMENREYGQIIGNPEAPYINTLAKHEGACSSSEKRTARAPRR